MYTMESGTYITRIFPQEIFAISTIWERCFPIVLIHISAWVIPLSKHQLACELQI